MGQMGQIQVKNQAFCDFLTFSSLVFVEIAYNDSLQEYLISSGGKSTKNNFWAKIWTNGAKIVQKLLNVFHFLKFCALVFLGTAYNDSLELCITSIRGKTGQNRVQNQVFLPFSQD